MSLRTEKKTQREKEIKYIHLRKLKNGDHLRVPESEQCSAALGLWLLSHLCNDTSSRWAVWRDKWCISVGRAPRFLWSFLGLGVTDAMSIAQPSLLGMENGP
jgi:hypothetical protein